MSAKVYYYPSTGRANAVRLALSAANIPFEDVYPRSGFPPSEEDKAKWREIGGNITTNIPMLEMPDGKVYTQSSAIIRAIGRMGNLFPPNHGTDIEIMYTTEKLIEDAADLRNESYKSYLVWGAPQSACDAFIESVLPKHLGNFERQVEESNGDYFVGDSLTLVDVVCYDAIVNYGSFRVPGILDGFPKLQAWKGRVEEDKGIKKYLSSREYARLYKFGPESLGKPSNFRVNH
mmetsp:Transcript_10224/g.16157  ORF Transcript_10224/g.16157 Transcript_10224/m.16157 type:complete len:233 (+) Transcript_10224:59-757(+)|eukprot:CAMPEP_0201605720 /NCGR_PEP_ID=MMETSP0492-20130828/5441_1 /ASSEMBLY_ACC=CAM_ASM_000837 /TAXON_ID=420259 /ORGANISM="Thalassiosira gravida, Strain GMp14c1" /LENGTH=232 /DNA_ID=CAMNT_0048070023 /DNA_START=99 /DNA_END=797 /DNA_ORIENTATION=+